MGVWWCGGVALHRCIVRLYEGSLNVLELRLVLVTHFLAVWATDSRKFVENFISAFSDSRGRWK